MARYVESRKHSNADITNTEDFEPNIGRSISRGNRKIAIQTIFIVFMVVLEGGVWSERGMVTGIMNRLLFPRGSRQSV